MQSLSWNHIFIYSLYTGMSDLPGFCSFSYYGYTKVVQKFSILTHTFTVMACSMRTVMARKMSKFVWDKSHELNVNKACEH